MSRFSHRSTQSKRWLTFDDKKAIVSIHQTTAEKKKKPTEFSNIVYRDIVEKPTHGSTTSCVFFIFHFQPWNVRFFPATASFSFGVKKSVAKRLSRPQDLRPHPYLWRTYFGYPLFCLETSKAPTFAIIRRKVLCFQGRLVISVFCLRYESSFLLSREFFVQTSKLKDGRFFWFVIKLIYRICLFDVMKQVLLI